MDFAGLCASAAPLNRHRIAQETHVAAAESVTRWRVFVSRASAPCGCPKIAVAEPSPAAARALLFGGCRRPPCCPCCGLRRMRARRIWRVPCRCCCPYLAWRWAVVEACIRIQALLLALFAAWWTLRGHGGRAYRHDGAAHARRCCSMRCRCGCRCSVEGLWPERGRVRWEIVVRGLTLACVIGDRVAGMAEPGRHDRAAGWRAAGRGCRWIGRGWRSCRRWHGWPRCWRWRYRPRCRVRCTRRCCCRCCAHG